MQVPELIRAQDPALQNLPLLQFKGETFLVQVGPRVVSLVTKQNSYPGWPAIRTELVWLLEKIQAAGFVRELSGWACAISTSSLATFSPISGSTCMWTASP